MFALNEKVVYPGHGVAKINRIIDRKIAGKPTSFFELTFLNKDMTILVPVHNVISVGIRPLSSQQNINDILKMLAQPIKCSSTERMLANWNKRNKGYQGKIRTGNIRDICEIYRDLKYIEATKELSFGEKNLLQQTEALLVEEISLVQEVGKDKAAELLHTVVAHMNTPIKITATTL